MKDEDHSKDQVIISIKDTGISIPEEIFPIYLPNLLPNP